MKRNFLIVGLLSVFATYNANAADSLQQKSIKNLSMGWSGEGVYIDLNETVAPIEGCTESRLIMTPDTPLFDENLSFLLSAFHTQAKLELRVDGCYGGTMRVKSVALIGG